MPGVMSQAHIDGFLADVRRANGGFTESRSSLRGLFTQLRATSANPMPMTVIQAKHFCGNANDPRLLKYDTALRNLTSVWGSGKPYPGHQVAIGRLMFRGDTRGPDDIFHDGFAARLNTGLRYRNAQEDIDPTTAVAISFSPYVAANFPLPASWGPNAFQDANNETCWVYALYVEEGFNTMGTQSLNFVGGSQTAVTVLYAGEVATGAIPGNRVLACVRATRNFAWVHIPKPADWFSRGTFSFQPATWRENNAYSGPERDTFVPMVRTLLTDPAVRAFPH